MKVTYINHMYLYYNIIIHSLTLSLSIFQPREILIINTLKLNKEWYTYINLEYMALDVRLSEWCCSVSMVWVQIPSREEQNLTALKSNSNTVWFNFQTYIIFSINLVSFKVTLRSSGTDILYGCHLLLDVCIIYFISCDCIMNSSLSYTIILKIAVKL